ncbi:NACHT domain-containing NTPase [Cyanobacteria bacterium FACHB-DQ100]|nr:NACHT domain-containing NTPase [Cyanobacteria bacterium FACHB-DQ100]
MASRSLQACCVGVEQIAHALTHQKLSQEELGGDICQPATSKKFCRGEKVDRRIFVKLCEKLGLNWEEITGIAAQSIAPDGMSDTSMGMVQKFRDHIRPHLQKRCGTMRVLDMSQPIGLDDIYTNVNILEKITGRRRLELSELLQTVSAENVERFSLGAVKGKPIPGLKAVEQYSKLMILGKPGAGKTTFLKHLAIQCIGGRFQPQQVPIFITLKEFAEIEERPDLLKYIGLYLECDEPETIRELLDRGNALILLDGLDEVRETDVSHVLRQIQRLSERYHRNQFVVTCRIAAREYTFEQFTEIEVADFDNEQIAYFTNRWFQTREDEVKADRFLEQLKAHPPIQELATSPLLLTLLCLVFEDSGDFSANRSELYQDGVDVLMKKWDVKRNIERKQVYKKLSLHVKQNLLGEIALKAFEKKEYFLKKKTIEAYIASFIRNLPNAADNEEMLRLDSEVVLNSIEAQHGLLIERAKGIYSFSHLTFQEYFAAREIKEKTAYSKLVDHVFDRRWREVFLLTAGMIRQADELLLMMKKKIDTSASKDEKLQQFLAWVAQKANSVAAPYKLPAIRAFYFALGDAELHSIDRLLSIAMDENILEIGRLIDHRLFDVPCPDAESIAHSELLLDNLLDGCVYWASCSDFQNTDIQVRRDDESQNVLSPAVIFVKQANFISLLSPQLHQKLQPFLQQIIELHGSDEAKYRERLVVVDQMRSVIVQERNIALYWRFDFQNLKMQGEQIKMKKKYNDANKLLIDCLNSDCYVSRGVREKIESTLLLPFTEIQNLQSSESQS